MTGTTFDRIYPVSLEWLWQDKIMKGDVTLLLGDSGIGKGYLVADIVASVTNGTNLPGDEHDRRPGEVVLISLEDQPDVTTVHRLIAAGADRSKVIDLSEVDAKQEYNGDTIRRKFSIQTDCGELNRVLRERKGQVELVVIDPLTAATTASLAGNLAARATMQKLQDVCERSGVAMLVIHHPVKGRAKSSGTGLSIKDRAGGSKGITDAVRLMLGLERDPESGERMLSVIKSNVCPDDDPPIRYKIRGKHPATHIEWLGSYAEEAVVDAELPAEGTEAYKVWETIRDYRAPVRAQELSLLADVKLGTVRSVLTRLTEAGHVVTAGYGLHVAVQNFSAYYHATDATDEFPQVRDVNPMQFPNATDATDATVAIDSIDGSK